MYKTFTIEVELSPAEVAAVRLYALSELRLGDAEGGLTSAGFEEALKNIFNDRVADVRNRMLSNSEDKVLFRDSVPQQIADEVLSVGSYDQFSEAYRVGFLQCLYARLAEVELFCPYQENVGDFAGLRDGLTKTEHEENYREFMAGVEDARFFSAGGGVDPLWVATDYKKLRQSGLADKDAKEFALQNWWDMTSAD